MKKKFVNLSNKLDAVAVEIIEIITTVASTKDNPPFIVGATARDLFFNSIRATMDLDLGIHIASWEMYETIKNVHTGATPFTFRILPMD